MKISMKATLLSGFVFPGLGQLYLKRYRRGIIIIVLVLVGLAIVVGVATISALEIVKEIQMQSGTVDMAHISNMAAAAVEGRFANHPSKLYYKISLLLIVGCWLFSIIDVYRTGKGD